MTATGEEVLAPRGRFLTSVSGLPPTFWWLWSGTLLNRVGSFVQPFLALYLTTERGFSLGQAGLVLAAFGAGGAIAQLVGGALADRIGRRATMVTSLVAAAAALTVLGFATTLPALALSVFAYGLCLDAFRPAVQSAVADLVPERDRPRAYALQFWAINLGFSVAVPLGGVLASQGYQLLFALDAAASLVFAGLILRRVPETRPARVEGDDPGSLRQVLRDRLMLLLVASVVLQAAVYMQAFTTLPVVVARDDLGTAEFGVVLGLNGVLIVVLQPFLLGVIGRRERGRLLLVAALLQGGGIALHGLADSIAAHLAAVVVWTTGEVLQAGLLGAVVAGLAPVHLRGRYMGVFGLSFGLAGMTAPVLGTQVLERFGEAPLWLGCVAVATLSGVGLLRVSRAADRRADRAASPSGA